MINHSMLAFSETIRSTWGPLTSELIANTRANVGSLLNAPPNEPWLAELLADAPDSRELYRDREHDFLLLGHTEPAGLYRPPHDHGRGWVIYAVVQGEMQMSTYRRVHDLRGNARLVEREVVSLHPGDLRVFLPGDIHDTRCMAGPLTLLRFTSRDLKKEDVTRYPEPNGDTPNERSVKVP